MNNDCNCNKNHGAGVVPGGCAPRRCGPIDRCGLFNTEVLPVSAGTDTKGEPFAPKFGAYTNTIVQYLANGAVYFYDSKGIWTKIVENGDFINITEALNNEITARKNADEQLNQAIFQTAEMLQTNINAEVNARESDRDNLQININEEVNRAEAAEQKLTADITAEQDAREEADTDIRQSIANISMELGNFVSSKGNSTAIQDGATVGSDNSIAFGVNANATSDLGYAYAIGYKANANQDHSVALGSNAVTGRQEEISIGSGLEDSFPQTRFLANVRAGVNETDAVNLKQMQDYVAEHGGTGGNDPRLTDTGAERANNLDANSIIAINTTPQLTATTVGIGIAGKDLDTNGTLTATVTLPSATDTEAGVMSAADKTKLDSLSASTNLTSVPTAAYTADNVNLTFGDETVELTPAVGTAGGANSKAGIMSAFQASQLAALAEAYKDTTQGITLYEGSASVNYIDLSDNAWNYDHIVVVGEYMSEGSAAFHQSVSAEFYPNSTDGINTFQLNAIDIVANDTPIQTTLQDIWMLDEEGTELSLVAGMRSSITGGATTTLTVEPETTSIFTITKVVGYGKKIA